MAVLAAYNEEAAIAKVVARTKKNVDRVIVCDDGSTDSTAEIAEALGVEVIRHQRNMGKGAALSDLFLKAASMSPEVVVTIDADGQHDPGEIPKLVNSIRDGADVVVGTRSFNDIPRVRRAGNRILGSASMTGVSDTQSGFRAYRGSRISELIPVEMGMGADTEILTKAKNRGMKVAEVPVSVSYDGNTPTHNPVIHTLDVLLSTVKQISMKHPMMFYGIPGFTSLLIAVGFWAWTFDTYARHHTIYTNVALIAVATSVVGLILMAVAILLWVLISVVRENR